MNFCHFCIPVLISVTLSQTHNVQLKHTCTCTLYMYMHAHTNWSVLPCSLLSHTHHIHVHTHTCRFVSLTESQFFEATMKADRSLKCMASMTSVWGSMVTPMSGSILLTSSTTFLSLLLWMDRWKGGEGMLDYFIALECPSPFLSTFHWNETKLVNVIMSFPVTCFSMGLPSSFLIFLSFPPLLFCSLFSLLSFLFLSGLPSVSFVSLFSFSHLPSL